ncbi:MAG: RrF2 family transcriptional regulator [Clostridia bacterium]
MKLSTRGQYATRAMVQLALKANEEPLSIREIALIEDLSEQYLEQIFRDLRKAGLVQSIRGAHGGYLLKSETKKITVGDVIRAVEGPIVPVSCLAAKEDCEKSDHCVSRKVWLKLQDSILEVLDKTSLDDMVEMVKEEG